MPINDLSGLSIVSLHGNAETRAPYNRAHWMEKLLPIMPYRDADMLLSAVEGEVASTGAREISADAFSGMVGSRLLGRVAGSKAETLYTGPQQTVLNPVADMPFRILSVEEQDHRSQVHLRNDMHDVEVRILTEAAPDGTVTASLKIDAAIPQNVVEELNGGYSRIGGLWPQNSGNRFSKFVADGALADKPRFTATVSGHIGPSGLDATWVGGMGKGSEVQVKLNGRKVGDGVNMILSAAGALPMATFDGETGALKSQVDRVVISDLLGERTCLLAGVDAAGRPVSDRFAIPRNLPRRAVVAIEGPRMGLLAAPYFHPPVYAFGQLMENAVFGSVNTAMLGSILMSEGIVACLMALLKDICVTTGCILAIVAAIATGGWTLFFAVALCLGAKADAVYNMVMKHIDKGPSA